MDTAGEREGGTESGTETYTLLCVRDSQWGFVVCHRELNLMLCDNLNGWDGVGDGWYI